MIIVTGQKISEMKYPYRSPVKRNVETKKQTNKKAVKGKVNGEKNVNGEMRTHEAVLVKTS